MTTSRMDLNALFGVAGKVAIVTGGSRGIGRMISEGYVSNGARVYITARKADACTVTAAELTAMGPGECIAIPANLATSEGRKAFVAEIQQREAKIDILVNNAGAAWGQPFEEFTEAGYDKTLEINLKAPFFLIQQLLPQLRAAGRPGDPARVINIGSIDGLMVPAQVNFPYGPSKAAVHHMTRVLAIELAPDHVTVNAIAPGPFESQMMAATLADHKDRIEASNPLGRIGKPEDMAATALFLAGAGASYVTGVVIPVDGGIRINPYGSSSIAPDA